MQRIPAALCKESQCHHLDQKFVNGEGEERIARQRALVARLAQMAIRRTRQLGCCKSFRPSSATTSCNSSDYKFRSERVRLNECYGDQAWQCRNVNFASPPTLRQWPGPPVSWVTSRILRPGLLSGGIVMLGTTQADLNASEVSLTEAMNGQIGKAGATFLLCQIRTF